MACTGYSFSGLTDLAGNSRVSAAGVHPCRHESVTAGFGGSWGFSSIIHYLFSRKVCVAMSLRKAFTLVELLVVIAIIAILIALLPAFLAEGQGIGDPDPVPQ